MQYNESSKNISINVLLESILIMLELQENDSYLHLKFNSRLETQYFIKPRNGKAPVGAMH